MFPIVIGCLLFAGNAYSASFEGCYNVPFESYKDLPHYLDDDLNNVKCVEFCRARFFNLGASSGKLCACLENLPSDVIAFPAEGSAASGSTSSCNRKCPGDYHNNEDCEGESCCGGFNGIFSVYATGDVDFLSKLLRNIRRNKDVIKEKYPDMQEYGFVQFKAMTGRNITKHCLVSLSQEISSLQCGDAVEGSNLYAPFIELEVEGVEEQTSKSYPSQSVPLLPFDLSINNLGESTETEFSREHSVETSSSQTYTTESGSDHSFSVGLTVSTEFDVFGQTFGVELSAEYAYSTFYNTGYEKSKDESISDSFSVNIKVPANSRKVASFSKTFSRRTLKWRSTVKATGYIQIFPQSGPANISMTEILSPSERKFYVFGTIDGEANPLITCTIDTYNAANQLVESKPATESEVQKAESNTKKDSRSHDSPGKARKHKKRMQKTLKRN